MLPNVRTSVMSGKHVAGVLAQVQRENYKRRKETLSAFKQPIINKCDQESSAYYSVARLWNDGIMAPKDTRKVLGLS
ncbi:putative ClpP/crotonase-like domain superfamily, acetyl-CoA carboxylase [Plasmopara halstedii]